MKHLMVVAIGPAQEFIASARRSRDLWFGSWLLNELSKAAARKIAGLNGDRIECLIFPVAKDSSQLDPHTDLGVANKILGKITGNPRDVAKAIREAVAARLQTLTGEAYSHLDPNSFDLDTARRQVSDMLEFYWAAVEVTENPDGGIQDYNKARDKVEALLAARKTTRTFDKVSWGSGTPKSSLDGQRESVIPEREYPPPNANRAVKEERAQKLWELYNVRAGERLCGVGLLKRHGLRGNDPTFFSTSHVAALPLMDRFSNANATQLKDYKKAFEVLSDQLRRLGVSNRDFGNTPGKTDHPVFGRRDGHLLFDNRLSDFISNPHNLELARHALRCFLKQTVDKEPLPYYALLHADGDRMGKVIDNQDTEGKHRKLSEALARFAIGVKDIVENQFGGSLVYSGGDDVLAFLPLHRAIECAKALAADFAKRMQEEKDKVGRPVFRDKDDRTPTLSAGLVIAHHLDPLSDTLDLARKAEKIAKSITEKNALAVTVSKRSGVDRTVKGKWGSFDKRLELFVGWHYQDLVPDGAAYELNDLARRLTVEKSDSNEFIYATLQKAIHAEARRIWKRKRAKHGTTKVGEDIMTEIKGLLESGEVRVAQLAEELIVAKLFADAKLLANPPAITAATNGGANT